MWQVLSAGKPGLPATHHGDLNVFSCRSGRTRTADAMERGWCAGRPEPLSMPTLDNAPIGDVADAPLLDQRCGASRL
jgi:hypothetical protein